jgi:hypothetical protein
VPLTGLLYTLLDMARPRKSTISNAALLEAALRGLELERANVNGQIAEVQRMLGRRGPGRPAKSASAPAAAASAPATTKTGRKPLSAAARKRIAIAQKKRWAKFHKAGAPAKSE